MKRKTLKNKKAGQRVPVSHSVRGAAREEGQGSLDLQFLTTNQAAHRMNVDCSTVRRFIRKRELGCYKLSAGKYGRVRIKASELDAFMESRKV